MPKTDADFVDLVVLFGLFPLLSRELVIDDEEFVISGKVTAVEAFFNNWGGREWGIFNVVQYYECKMCVCLWLESKLQTEHQLAQI